MPFKIHGLEEKIKTKRLSEMPFGELAILRSGRRAGDVVYRFYEGAVSLQDPNAVYKFDYLERMLPEDPQVEMLPTGKYELEVTA